MSHPIPAGFNIKINHKMMNNHFSMASADVYGDIYGIGFLISADRMIITPEKTIIIRPGNVQFMDKNLFHRTTYLSEGIYENMDIKFRESVANKVILAIGQEQFDRLFHQINLTLTPAAIEQIRSITQLMEQEWEHYDSYSDTVLTNLVIQFFITAIRGQVPPTPDVVIERSRNTPFVTALEYLQREYASDPSLITTAAAAHISPGHLSRLFKSELGTSYSRFLTEIKINHASQLLVNTTLSILEIAGQCGYQNSNYFCDAFKKVMEISPMKYRMQMRKV